MALLALIATMRKIYINVMVFLPQHLRIRVREGLRERQASRIVASLPLRRFLRALQRQAAHHRGESISRSYSVPGQIRSPRPPSHLQAQTRRRALRNLIRLIVSCSRQATLVPTMFKNPPLRGLPVLFESIRNMAILSLHQRWARWNTLDTT